MGWNVKIDSVFSVAAGFLPGNDSMQQFNTDGRPFLFLKILACILKKIDHSKTVLSDFLSYCDKQEHNTGQKFPM